MKEQQQVMIARLAAVDAAVSLCGMVAYYNTASPVQALGKAI